MSIGTPRNRADGHAKVTGAAHEGPGMVGLEIAMNELAYALTIDPLELRLRNYAERDRSLGLAFSSKKQHECYLGARGIGELGAVGVGPAIANAVFHATGIRVRDLPIRPEVLLV